MNKRTGMINNGYFTTIAIDAWLADASEREAALLNELLDDQYYITKLIQKGFIAPDKKTIIDPHTLRRKLDRCLTTGHKDEKPESLAERFMHQLGASKGDTAGIPIEAFDCSLSNDVIPGKNMIAYTRMTNVDFHHGLMLGGIGTGGIERTPQGGFNRVSFTYVAHSVEDTENNKASQFHVYMKTPARTFAGMLSTDKPGGLKMSRFKRRLHPSWGSYHALYPCEWHNYESNALPGKVRIKSFSPVIKDNYKETSYPLVVYKVCIENTTAEAMDCGFMVTFQNLVGRFPECVHNTESEPFNMKVDRKSTLGINTVFDIRDKDDDNYTGHPAIDLISRWSRPDNAVYNKIVEDDANNVFLLMGSNREQNKEPYGQIALGVKKTDGMTVSYINAFDADGDGHEVESFYETGELECAGDVHVAGNNKAGALAFKITGLAPRAKIEVPVVLSYDFPYCKHGKKLYAKRYTSFFGDSGKNAVAIAAEGLAQYEEWEKAVHKSQQDMCLAHTDLPVWYRGAALNKLNLLQSNSIGWLVYDEGDNPAAKEVGLHLMGEANKIDYDHIEPFDVRHYSCARALFWPKLEQGIVNYYAETVPLAETTKAFFNFVMLKKSKYFKKLSHDRKSISQAESSNEKARLKRDLKLFYEYTYNDIKFKDSLLHDIWSSETGPMLNSYRYQNTDYWPGLPPRGILTALRDYRLCGDREAFKRQYQIFVRCLHYAHDTLDYNQDSIPDFLVPEMDDAATFDFSLWTYDNWEWNIEQGLNAYTAGLWLTGLAAALKGADILGIDKDRKTFTQWLEKGKALFDQKLWKSTGPTTGYYRLGEKNDEIFSDYLYLFYNKLLDLNVFPTDKIIMTLKTVYEHNVKKYGNGYMGAVNATHNGVPLDLAQSIEMWTGTSFVLGATLIAYGLDDEGWNIIYGTENFVTNQAGHFADWAEAYTIQEGKNGIPAYGMRAKNYYRSLGITSALALLKR